MMINSNTMVSMTDANQNFSKVARLVDQNGSAVILRNNAPKYIVLQYSEVEKAVGVNDDELLAVSKKFIAENKEVYEVLAQ